MRGPRSRAWFMAKPVTPPKPMPTAQTKRPTPMPSIMVFSPTFAAMQRMPVRKTNVSNASIAKLRGRLYDSVVGLVEKMLRMATGSTSNSDALKSSA